MEVVEQKKELRKLILEWKNQFPEDLKRQQEKSVFAILERLPQFTDTKKVGFYWSLKSEFSTHDFIAKWSGSKEIYLPKIVDNQLLFSKFNNTEALEKNSLLGVMEPTGETIAASDLDLLIVPGEAFSQRGNRLGKGGGFYDRLLREHNCYSVALCYDFQMIDELPLEEHDENVDLVLYYRGL